jgi:predicted PurR-regulated permease PerM
MTDANAPDPTDVPPWLPRAYRLAIAYVLATLALLWLLNSTRSLVGLLILSALISLSLEAAVNWLHDRGWRRGRATALLVLGGIGFFVALGVLVVPIMARNVGQIAQDVPSWIDRLNAFTTQHFGGDLISQEVKGPSGTSIEHVRTLVTNYGGRLLGTVGGVVGAVFSVFTVAMFVFFMTANAPKIRRSIVSLVRPERQRDVLWAWNVAIEKTGAYLYQKVLLALINGSLMLVVMLLLGIPFAVPLAVFTGFTAAFIPIVGTYVAGVVPVVIALAAKGPAQALALLAWILIYQQLENYVLEPRLSQRTMELNAGIALGAALAGGSVGGLIGAFFALPLAAAIQSFIGAYATRYDVERSPLTDEDVGLTPPDAGGG